MTTITGTVNRVDEGSNPTKFARAAVNNSCIPRRLALSCLLPGLVLAGSTMAATPRPGDSAAVTMSASMPAPTFAPRSPRSGAIPNGLNARDWQGIRAGWQARRQAVRAVDGRADELERLRAHLGRAVADQEPIRPVGLRRYVKKLAAPRLRALGREIGLELPIRRSTQSRSVAVPDDRESLERFRHRVLERLHGFFSTTS